MPTDAQGYWYPELSPKQLVVFNNYARYTLVSGPKKSGKSLVNLHRLVRHAVELPAARVAVFAKTIRNSKAGGIWNDLIEIILPEWFNAKVTKYTSKRADNTYGPKQDAQSRMMYFKIRNRSGGQAEFQLHSIDNENEVESIAKGTRFSAFYFAELSNFKHRLVFDITSDQLRMPGLKFSDHIWLADTNPSDEGEDSWMWQLWYGLLAKKDKNEHEQVLASHLRIIEIMIEDNPYLEPEEKKDLYAKFAHDPDLKARYIDGRWVRASVDAIFRAQFSHELHVLGDASSTDESQWDVILPSEHCRSLISGWDMGDRFMSAHIIERVETEQGATYCVLDEVNHLDKDTNVGLSEFCESFMQRYRFWMDLICGEDAKLRNIFEWRHWSDSSAMTNWRSGAEDYDKNLVLKYTDGDVVLGAPQRQKISGMIGKGLNLIKILLFERRLIVSARCVRTIEMFKAVRRGTGTRLVDKSQPVSHVLDSLRYALAAEEPQLLIDEILTSEAEKEKAGGLLSIPL